MQRRPRIRRVRPQNRRPNAQQQQQQQQNNQSRRTGGVLNIQFPQRRRHRKGRLYPPFYPRGKYRHLKRIIYAIMSYKLLGRRRVYFFIYRDIYLYLKYIVTRFTYKGYIFYHLFVIGCLAIGVFETIFLTWDESVRPDHYIDWRYVIDDFTKRTGVNYWDHRPMSEVITDLCDEDFEERFEEFGEEFMPIIYKESDPIFNIIYAKEMAELNLDHFYDYKGSRYMTIEEAKQYAEHHNQHVDDYWYDKIPAILYSLLMLCFAIYYFPLPPIEELIGYTFRPYYEYYFSIIDDPIDPWEFFE